MSDSPTQAPPPVRGGLRRSLAKVAGGNLARNLASGLLKLVVAGLLPPQALGVLRSVYGLFRILASACDLGLDHATITFASRVRDDAAARARILGTSLSIKLMTALAVVVAGNLAAPWAAATLLGDAELVGAFRLLVFAIGGQLAWRYATSWFSVMERFGRLAWFLTASPVLMLATVAVLVALDRFTLEAAIAVYLLAPGVTTLLWWPAIGDRRLVHDRSTASSLLGFSGWVYFSNLSSTARSHLNPVLLKAPALSGSVAAGETQAGLYGFASDLAGEITILSSTLMSVLLPRTASITDPAEMRTFLRRAYRRMWPVVLALLPVVWLAEPMLHLLARIKPSFLEYLPSLDVFAILFAGNLLSLAVIPMQTAIYAARVPQVETLIEAIGIAILVGGGMLVIPTAGALGCALVLLGHRVLATVLFLAYGHWRLGAAAARPA